MQARGKVALVAETGRALPPNYQALLDIIELAGPGAHLSADQIWERARRAMPHIGFATVHRGLARLRDAGSIMKIDLPGETTHLYEAPAPAHAHFRCGACGSLHDLAYEVPAAVVDALAERNGWSIDTATVYFTGRCAPCTERAGDATAADARPHVNA